MKLKRLIKFYFNADKLNNFLDGLLEFRACNVHTIDADADFDRVAELVGDKVALGRLYSYLNGIMDGLTECDRTVLHRYALLRVDIKRLCDEAYKEYKRTAMKFSRKLRYLGAYDKELSVLKKYVALI